MGHHGLFYPHSLILWKQINTEVTRRPGPAAAATSAAHAVTLCSPWSEIDVFIYVGECRSTKLFIISIPWAAWTNELFQPNNSAIGGRYWMQLQHRIIHSRQQRRAKQLGSHLHYGNEKQSLACQGTLHSYDMTAFISAACQIKLRRVQHRNEINQTLLADRGKCMESVHCLAYYMWCWHRKHHSQVLHKYNLCNIAWVVREPCVQGELP